MHVQSVHGGARRRVVLGVSNCERISAREVT